MLVLLKNHLNYLKDIVLECFFKEYNGFICFVFLKTFTTCNDGKFKS